MLSQKLKWRTTEEDSIDLWSLPLPHAHKYMHTVPSPNMCTRATHMLSDSRQKVKVDKASQDDSHSLWVLSKHLTNVLNLYCTENLQKPPGLYIYAKTGFPSVTHIPHFQVMPSVVLLSVSIIPFGRQQLILFMC